MSPWSWRRRRPRYSVPTSGGVAEPALLRVLDDPVAVPLAGGEAEQDVEFDRPERQKPVDGAFAIHAQPRICVALICVAHISGVNLRYDGTAEGRAAGTAIRERRLQYRSGNGDGKRLTGNGDGTWRREYVDGKRIDGKRRSGNGDGKRLTGNGARTRRRETATGNGRRETSSRTRPTGTHRSVTPIDHGDSTQRGLRAVAGHCCSCLSLFPAALSRRSFPPLFPVALSSRSFKPLVSSD